MERWMGGGQTFVEDLHGGLDALGRGEQHQLPLLLPEQLHHVRHGGRAVAGTGHAGHRDTGWGTGREKDSVGDGGRGAALAERVCIAGFNFFQKKTCTPSKKMV